MLCRVRLLTLFAAFFATCAAVDANEWTQYRGDAGRTGYVATSFPTGDFTQAWHFPITFDQSGTGSWFEHGVTTDGRRAYVTALEGYAPAGNYHVMAIDLVTGTQSWRTTIAGRAFDGVSSPTVVNGTVYVNRAGHSGISGGTDADLPKMYGLNAATGAVKFATPYSAQWGENFRPIVAGTQLFAAGGYYGGFYAYNATTGAQQWFNDQTAWDPPNAAVAVDGQYVHIGARLLDRNTGAIVGQYNHPTGRAMTTPVLRDDEAFFATQNSSEFGLAAFDAATRTRQWEYAAPARIAGVSVGDETVAFTAGSTLTFLDRDGGGFLFSWAAPSTLGDHVILTNSHAFVSSFSAVFAIDLATQQMVWSRPFGGELSLSDNLLLVSNRSGVTAIAVPEPGASAAILLFVACGLSARGFGRRRIAPCPASDKR